MATSSKIPPSTRETYTSIVHEAEVDGGWSGQLRIVVGKGLNDQELVFVDSDLLGARRLVLALEQTAEVARALGVASASMGCTSSGPAQEDVDALRDALDVMATFSSNDQRARYLLSSNWLHDPGTVASARLRAMSAVESTL